MNLLIGQNEPTLPDGTKAGKVRIKIESQPWPVRLSSSQPISAVHLCAHVIQPFKAGRVFFYFRGI